MSQSKKSKEAEPGKPHRFQPGNKQGRGRRQGSRNKMTIALQELLDGEAEAITRVLIDKAKSADMTAIRLCIGRLIPVMKERPVKLDFGSIETAAGVARAFDSLLQAVGHGEITPNDAALLTSVLESRRRVIETLESEQKIAALEKACQGPIDKAA
jgi:hypothetical protein